MTKTLPYRVTLAEIGQAFPDIEIPPKGPLMIEFAGAARYVRIHSERAGHVGPIPEDGKLAYEGLQRELGLARLRIADLEQRLLTIRAKPRRKPKKARPVVVVTKRRATGPTEPPKAAPAKPMASRKAMEILVDGIRFGSLKDAADAHGASYPISYKALERYLRKRDHTIAKA